LSKVKSKQSQAVSGSVETLLATKKGHTDCALKVEYVLFLSKIKSPQSAYDKLRTIGPYEYKLENLGMYMLRLYFNLPIYRILIYHTSSARSQGRKPCI